MYDLIINSFVQLRACKGIHLIVLFHMKSWETMLGNDSKLKLMLYFGRFFFEEEGSVLANS